MRVGPRRGGQPAKTTGFISPGETDGFATGSQALEIIGGAKWGISRNCLFSMTWTPFHFAPFPPTTPLTSCLKEPRNGVSKDAPADVDAAALWIILRDARLRLAPQNEVRGCAPAIRPHLGGRAAHSQAAAASLFLYKRNRTRYFLFVKTLFASSIVGGALSARQNGEGDSLSRGSGTPLATGPGLARLDAWRSARAR